MTDPSPSKSRSRALERIDGWRAKLLDSSLSNPLLAMRRNAGLSILSPDPWGLPALWANASDGVPLSASEAALASSDPEEDTTETAHASGRARLSRSILAPAHRIELDAAHAGALVLDTPSGLQPALARLDRLFRSALDESGIHTLFLAAGTLRWTPAGRSLTVDAPAVLIPVQLKRKNPRSDFVLMLADADAVLNPAIEHTLMRDAGVDWAPVNALLAQDPIPWSELRGVLAGVLPAGVDLLDDARLGLFSYAKHRMWSDVAQMSTRLVEHPIVKRLLDPTTPPPSCDMTGLDWPDIDTTTRTEKLCLPLPADASQIIAITRAVRGESLVVKGPPGTGKSQTITNMICSFLSRGKSVLFVAEKMTALSVVHNRMVEMGLGPYCLELHARSCERRAVLNQFAQVLDAPTPPSPKDPLPDDLDVILNESISLLHTPLLCGLTPHDAIGRHARLVQDCPGVQDLCARLGLFFPDALSVTADTMRSRQRHLRDLLSSDAALPPAAVVFRDAGIDPDSEDRFWPLLDSVLMAAADVDRLGVDAALLAMSPSDVADCQEWAAIDPPVVSGRPPSKTALDVLADFHAADEAFAADWADWADRLDQAVFSAGSLVVSWADRDGLLKDWIRRRALRRALSPMARKPISDKEWLDLAVSWPRLAAAHDRVSRKALDLKSVATQEGFSGRLPAVIAALDDWQVFAARRESVRTKTSAPARAAMASTGLLSALPALVALTAALTAWSSLLSTPPGSLASAIVKARQFKAARGVWGAYGLAVRSERTARQAGLGALVDASASGLIQPESAAQILDAAFLSDLVQQFRWRHPSAEKAFGRRRTEMIRDLSSRRVEEMASSSARLAVDLHARTRLADQDPMAVLIRREMAKKRRLITPRALLAAAAGRLRDIKPCLFMSPMSVAEFLQTEADFFDVVIFDESSQIPTADAVGSIARAKQTVMVGDPKQMPPSRSFARIDPEDAEDADDDLDSVLTECLTGPMPSVTLNWHYRSRHEDLIAFSNRMYYAGSLITFPTPDTRSAFTVHDVAGVYDRGRAGTNRDEAVAVVAAMENHIRSSPHLSLGVITFNQKQQLLIERLWDDKLAATPDLDEVMEVLPAPISIKNLETVQGDERDVVMFSTTFGRDPSGRFPMNFGPLGQIGGERRLNVAITRARTHMHVFTSFHPSDIDISRIAHQGVKDFKAWLQFVRGGEKALIAASSEPLGLPDSPFEVAVRRALTEKGWDVRSQIGCSGYRIDLAVVHPDHPGSYLAGVECDGATYHSFRSARDRDHQRQKLLEGLGWSILRVWSTGWFDDPDFEIERLHADLNALLMASRQSES